MELEWRDPDEVTDVSTSVGDGSLPTSEHGEKEGSDATHCSTPNKEHTITFKCIGTTHDLHAQEVPYLSVLKPGSYTSRAQIYAG